MPKEGNFLRKEGNFLLKEGNFLLKEGNFLLKEGISSLKRRIFFSKREISFLKEKISFLERVEVIIIMEVSIEIDHFGHPVILMHNVFICEYSMTLSCRTCDCTRFVTDYIVDKLI